MITLNREILVGKYIKKMMIFKFYKKFKRSVSLEYIFQNLDTFIQEPQTFQ